jgi:hypothetical protein
MAVLKYKINPIGREHRVLVQAEDGVCEDDVVGVKTTAHGLKERRTDIQTDIQTDRQTERQRERERVQVLKRYSGLNFKCSYNNTGNNREIISQTLVKAHAPFIALHRVHEVVISISALLLGVCKEFSSVLSCRDFLAMCVYLCVCVCVCVCVLCVCVCVCHAELVNMVNFSPIGFSAILLTSHDSACK